MFLLRLRERDVTTIDVPVGEPGLNDGGINSCGEIVGVFCDAAPCRLVNPDAHGFLIGDGHFDPFDFPRALVTNAFAINNDGDIVEVYDDAAGTHGFLLIRRE